MTRYLIMSGFLYLSLLTVPPLALASDSEQNNGIAMISMVQGGKDIAWHCTPPGTVAGGEESFEIGIRINVSSFQNVYSSLGAGWPNEINFEAGKFDKDSVFVPDSLLLELLELKLGYHPIQNVRDREAWEAKELEDAQKKGYFWISYYFIFSVPDQYSGERIYIRAIYDSPETGKILNVLPIAIIPQCDEKARQVALGSWVTVAHFQISSERAIQIADSLIDIGMTDVRGLMWAAGSARALNRPADELRFLDLNFQANDRVSIFNEPVSEYESRRKELIEIINKQQQQR